MSYCTNFDIYVFINELLHLAQFFLYCYRISPVCKFYGIPTPTEVGSFRYYNLIGWVRWKSTVIPFGSINISLQATILNHFEGPSWPWSYGRWLYNYLYNQCLSLLMLWVRIAIRARCTTLCDKVCQWLATGQWFSPVSSTNKTDRHVITEILLKVALNTINQNNYTGDA